MVCTPSSRVRVELSREMQLGPEVGGGAEGLASCRPGAHSEITVKEAEWGEQGKGLPRCSGCCGSWSGCCKVVGGFCLQRQGRAGHLGWVRELGS